MEKVFLTKSSFEKLKNELNYLNTVEKSKIINGLSEARERGNIDENSEYDILMEEYERLKLRILKIENMIINSVVIDNIDNKNDGVVNILNTVKVLNKKNNKIFTFTIVPETDIDVKNGKISSNSPIGSGLLNKKVGDNVFIETPVGVIEYEILEII